jgi:RNA polymerase sigma factor for flagellar operon FliA
MCERLGVTVEDYYKMVGDATAVSQVSLNKKWYETDSYKDVREIDILEDKKAEDPTNRIQNAEALALKYGRVIQFNRARTESLLWPTEELFGA